jgi:hypothetical protein
MARPRPYRTKYVAKLRTPPDSWQPDWLSRMDQRYRNLAIVRERLASLEADLSAADPEQLSFIQRRLANHLIWADTMAEELERQFARGEAIDVAVFANLVGILTRLGDKLGLKRAQRNVEHLRLEAQEAGLL